jgi:uncharacterized membrane protein
MASAIPDQLASNIEAVEALRLEAKRELDQHSRFVNAAARTLGQPRTLYTLVVAAAAWIGFNVAASHPVDDPPFFWLQGMLAVYAATVSTLVLAAQNVQNRQAEQAAGLELHVNLLAEQKTTKIISLLEELRRDLPEVRDRQDSEADALQEELDPQAVRQAIPKR